MADRPRSFAEVVAAMNPAERAWEPADRWRDPSVADEGHAWVMLFEDRTGNGEWRVEYQDQEGGCYLNVFAGPAAEWRARDYFQALKRGEMRIVRTRAVGN